MVECIGDCVEVIGGGSDDNLSDNKDISLVDENGAFPKTRYHVEGKPTGISVLEARTSFLKKQLRSKGNNCVKVIFYSMKMII